MKIPASILLLACLALAACQPPATHGTLIDPPMAAPDFTLLSDQGEVSKSDLQGRIAVLFFGFTHCPDICPDTMVRLRHAMAELRPHEAEQVQVVMISVDPERDDPATVGRYARSFDERFLGLTGAPEVIARVASGYGIYQRKVPMGDEDYTVDHTAALTVLNRQGETVLIWRYGLAPEEMAADLRLLLRRS